MKSSYSYIFNLNSLVALLFLVFVSQKGFSQNHPLKVSISTWQKSRASGRLESITDSTIIVRAKNGAISTFSASDTRNLKIRKPGIALPFGIAGAAGAGVIVNQLNNDVFIPQFIAAAPLGFISGLVVGNLLATKVSLKRVHLQDFKKVRAKLNR